jgi:hypothetical protein
MIRGHFAFSAHLKSRENLYFILEDQILRFRLRSFRAIRLVRGVAERGER